MEAVRRKLRIGVIGAAGRMGRRLTEAIGSHTALDLSALIDPAYAPSRPGGEDAPGLAGRYASVDDLPPGAVDAVVEFTLGDIPARLEEGLVRQGAAWLSGTTGRTEASRAAMERTARKVPVLWSANFSLGIALLRRLCGEAARLLPPDWEMEIVEAHHAAKVDAPSGTALALAEVWMGVRGGSEIHGRSGKVGPRPPGEVGVHAVRLPEGVGEHRLLLGGPAESLELSHRALDRSAFVAGALTAVQWLATKEPGLYTLDDWVEDRLKGRT